MRRSLVLLSVLLLIGQFHKGYATENEEECVGKSFMELNELKARVCDTTLCEPMGVTDDVCNGFYYEVIDKKGIRTSGKRAGFIDGYSLEDMNKNGKPELVILKLSGGNGHFVSPMIWEYRSVGQFDEIELPVIPDKYKAAYFGYDNFQIERNQLMWSFPLYQKGDAHCCPSGGALKLVYELSVDGWQLRTEEIKP